MTDSNVIYGVDFKGGSAPDVFDRGEAKIDHISSEVKGLIRILDSKGWADTSPSEYSAPDDCAC